HELSPINSKDFDRLWEGFEQQEVKDIFTASEAEPCAARSSSAGPKQDEVQPKQGEARPTADEKVGKGSRRANPKPRNKMRGKKSAEPAPPAGPQRPEDQPAQPAEAPREDLEGKPQRVFHIVFSHPREDDATRDSAAQILKLSVFQELHENEACSDASLGARPTYWGIVAYLAVPSESKPDVDASPWLSKGHPPVVELLSDIPKGAVHFKDIPTLLATVWDIQASTDNLKRLKMSPWELVCAAARDKCVCDGLWIPLMRDNLRVQCENFPPQMSQEEKPEEARLIAAITRTLQVGSEKFNNLFFYGP
ncbi:unnamed protein product, partial [Effrenium voratum]